VLSSCPGLLDGVSGWQVVVFTSGIVDDAWIFGSLFLLSTTQVSFGGRCPPLWGAASLLVGVERGGAGSRVWVGTLLGPEGSGMAPYRFGCPPCVCGVGVAGGVGFCLFFLALPLWVGCLLCCLLVGLVGGVGGLVVCYLNSGREHLATHKRMRFWCGVCRVEAIYVFVVFVECL
jgi:hypothetical protein